MNKTRAFTLIEVLVVVSILGVLMGLITILITKSSQTKNRTLSEQRVQRLTFLVDRYKQEMNRLPPMNIKELADAPGGKWKGLSVTPPNVTNECIETLLVALRHPDLSVPISEGDFPGDAPFGNIDEDIWNKIPDGSSDEYAREVLDAYGNVIVYIHKNNYDKPVEVSNALGEPVQVHAVKKANGTYYNQDTYQIICLGDNGVQDEDLETGDDIMNFTPIKE